MPPKISVIIATYYRNNLLSEAIESVANQDYEPVELVVVDDSGAEHARPVLEAYESVVDRPIYRSKEGDWGAAYTTGIAASTGEYVQFLDDDDLLLDGKLTKTAAVLGENPDVGVSYCGVIKEDEKYYPNPDVAGDILEHTLRFQDFPLWTGSMLMERDVLIDCLPLATNAGDPDLKIELAKRTEFDYVDECLAVYRREASSKWVGLKRFEEVMRVVRNQKELYDQYPEIRRSVFADWYEKQGKAYLKQRPWSPMATLCFAKSAYYDDENRHIKAIEAAASVFGRLGLTAASRVYAAARGTP
ncbi:Glycosyl transferase family 2 [Halalkaliarchaeum sp. AArc-CO]|uniref:glycosyltransferase family 2 protein n=1 Tax=Halalkaliarchaeum sp. AArc-CO TaxID=2866381 RepID=UPI00217D644D|nr:glycosyltransferase family 2 protein [Halalkaliarchaeum sp. AArc-CO]UWG50192.1 Glycosyl transferase family 2 [Halalkaliarchaeum sp. AArc-CO]